MRILWKKKRFQNKYWISMLLESMNKTSHSFVNFVSSVSLISRTWKNMQHQSWRREAIRMRILQSYSHKGDMNRHVASVHEGKRPLKCEFCDNTFSRQSNLIYHVSSVHEDKKLYNCEFCTQTFTLRCCMNEYVASIHEREKPFKWQFCNHSSSQEAGIPLAMFDQWTQVLLTT